MKDTVPIADSVCQTGTRIRPKPRHSQPRASEHGNILERKLGIGESQEGSQCTKLISHSDVALTMRLLRLEEDILQSMFSG